MLNIFISYIQTFYPVNVFIFCSNHESKADPLSTAETQKALQLTDSAGKSKLQAVNEVEIGHFQDATSLCFKMKPSAKPFL